MSKKESRIERKEEVKSLQEKRETSLNKVYYWIIAFLFFILFVLVLFIFSKSEAKVDLTENGTNNELVEKENEVSDADTNQSSENEAEDNQSDESEIEDDTDENLEDLTDEEDEQTIVNEDAPYDSDHAIDFNGGSADRIAIKERIIEATGLGNDLIEYWVGNNGPGRVSATVASPDQSEIYEVKLQYGDGEWHVTNYNSLDSLPDNFN